MLAYASMTRTTILIQDELLLEVKRVARTRGVTVTELIKNALKAYIESEPRPGLPSFTAALRREAPRNRVVTGQARTIAGNAVDPHEGSRLEGRR